MIRIRPLLKITLNNFRCCSTTINKNRNFIKISTDEKTNLITLTLNRPPVNGLDLDFLKELYATFSALEETKPKGVILTSFSDRVFSAGLDLTELYKPSQKRLRIFWRTLQDMTIKLYGFSYPIVAAVNGHAPAGGCLLALCCDYRIMVDNFTIGLNEVPVGITIPPWVILPMNNTINKRSTELALTTGKLFSTKEAFEAGVIDEIATDTTDAMNKAKAFFKRYATIDPEVSAATKNYIRNSDVEFMKSTQEQDVENSVNLFMRDVVQRDIQTYFNKLKRK